MTAFPSLSSHALLTICYFLSFIHFPPYARPSTRHLTFNSLWIIYSSVVYCRGSNTSIWRNGVGRNELCVATKFKTNVCVLYKYTNTHLLQRIRHSLASTGCRSIRQGPDIPPQDPVPKTLHGKRVLGPSRHILHVCTILQEGSRPLCI